MQIGPVYSPSQVDVKQTSKLTRPVTDLYPVGARPTDGKMPLLFAKSWRVIVALAIRVIETVCRFWLEDDRVFRSRSDRGLDRVYLAVKLCDDDGEEFSPERSRRDDRFLILCVVRVEKSLRRIAEDIGLSNVILKSGQL